MSGGAPKAWWQVRKELSLARKATTPSREACAKPGDSFLIVTEGEVTEPVYFELLRESLQLATVTVKIQPGRASDPRHVINSAADAVTTLARRVKKKQTAINEVEKYDHVWAVIDTDVAVRNGIWPDVQQLAASRGVKLAHSTPCFEFWLLLHIQGYTTRADLLNGTLAKEAVEKELGQKILDQRRHRQAGNTDVSGQVARGVQIRPASAPTPYRRGHTSAWQSLDRDRSLGLRTQRRGDRALSQDQTVIGAHQPRRPSHEKHSVPTE